MYYSNSTTTKCYSSNWNWCGKHSIDEFVVDAVARYLWSEALSDIVRVTISQLKYSGFY